MQPYVYWSAVCLAVFVVKYFWVNYRYYMHAFQFPRTLPGIPNCLQGFIIMAANKFNLYQAFSNIQQLASTDFSAIWCPSFTVVVRRVQHLHTLLTTKNTLDKSFHYDGLKYFMGKNKEGLLTASGEDFPPCKKLLYNTFNKSSPFVLFDSLLRGTELLMEDLEQSVGHGEFQMIRIARRFTTRNIIEYSAMTNEEVPRQYIYNLIREVEKDDSIDICAEMTTLIATGVTTAGAISACLVLLAMHPEAQQRVYLEDQQVQAALQGRTMVNGDLEQYQYLHRVVKETLRLCPSIPFLGRRAREDLKLGENTIPKGSAAVVFLPLFHRDPDNFPDPMRFDPDRFLPEEVAKRHKLSYLPFSYGPRMCPGMRYGIQSTVVAVSTVVRHYLVYTKYKTMQELDRQLRIYVTLVNAEGYPITLQRRTAAAQ